MTDRDPTIFVIDDDPSVRASLERLLRSVSLDVRTFASAQEFLHGDPPEAPGCLVLDVRMPGLSGLDLQEELANRGTPLPIIFMTGYGTIPMSVRAMKAGAVDFLEKPFDDQNLLDTIYNAIERSKGMKLERDEETEKRRLLDSLTRREREVFALVARGMLNKQIAYELGISEKTVKVHRARVMQKMHASSLADLVRLAGKRGVHTPKS